MTVPAHPHPTTTERRFDLICFDWDGTLFDSTHIITECLQEAVVAVGGKRPTPQQAAYVIGMPLAPALAWAAPDVPHSRYRELALFYHKLYVSHQNDLSLFPGVVAMLAALHQKGYRLAIATGKTRQGLDQVLKTCREQGNELADLFDDSRCADETAGKPNPLMLRELMDKWSAPPGRTLMIGDTTHDLQMAQNAGCASIGVSYGAHGMSEEFKAFSPLLVAETVASLNNWLLSNG